MSTHDYQHDLIAHNRLHNGEKNNMNSIFAGLCYQLQLPYANEIMMRKDNIKLTKTISAIRSIEILMAEI